MLRSFARLAVVGAVAVAGLAGLLTAASRRFGRQVEADRRRLLEAARPPHPPLVTEEMLAGLPEPAQRYLRYAGVVGRPMVDTVRVRQACRMRPGPGGFTFPLRRRAVVLGGAARLRLGRDGPRRGHPRGAGPGRLPRGARADDDPARLGHPARRRRPGPEMDQASLLRHLSEMPWFPSAFLRERVTWEAIDDSTVRVSIADGDLRATGTLEIDAEGRLVAFRSERYAMVGKGFELRPWTAPTYAYGEFEGLRLPVKGAAVWTLPDGTDLPYIELELTELEYDPPLPA